VSTPISVRFPDELARRLRRRGSGTGEATSGLVVRLVDEGIRMAEHPGVVFRDGPTGRRAGLGAGPDVWEIVVVLRDYTEGGVTEAVRRSAKWLGITEAQVRTAESYYASFPQEIDDRIEMNDAAADATQRAGDIRRRLYG
jgi:hypothetical protein